MNAGWLARGMPARCALPESEAGCRALLSSLPGYCPFETAEEGQWFDGEAAVRAIRFFHDRLKHVKAAAGTPAGTSFWLQPWQQAVVANLFGWKRADGMRRYREAMLFIARKNGKSCWCAGLCLYALCADGEKGAEVYSAASEKDQASLVFDHAKGMVAQCKAMKGRLRVYKAQKSIAYEAAASSYKVIDSIPEGAHGFNVHFAAVDELHAHKNRELVDVLLTGTGSRAQPLVVHLTTSDFEREGSVCNEKHDYATRVCRGEVDDSAFLPVLYEADKDDDWTDPDVWRKANPNLGVSITLEYLERECRRAKDDPSYENTFKRLHLNIRTQQDVRWIPLHVWDRGGPHRVDERHDPMEWREAMLERARERTLFGGLDLAASSDLTTYVLVWKEDDGSVVLLPWVWCPRETALKRERAATKGLGALYQTWANQGWMTLTDGDETDYDLIRRDIGELADKGYQPKTLAADRLFQGAQLCQQLKGDGFDVVAFGQGFVSMTAPTKRFGELVQAGKIRHGGHPIARWMAGNVAVELDSAGNIKPSRKVSTEKIDIIVGGIMALAMLEAAPEKKPSVYKKRGLVVIR